MNNHLFYAFGALVILLCLLLISILFYQLRRGVSKTNQSFSRMRCKISLESIEKCILPNNKGRSIDTVVEMLNKYGIVPEFHLDSV